MATCRFSNMGEARFKLAFKSAFKEKPQWQTKEFFKLVETIKRIVEEIGNEINPLKILAKIKAGISPSVFQGTFTKSSADIAGPKEVILSEYLIKNG